VNNVKIEFHLLQSFPPSCLNRDDTNMPKTCEFGGVTRARVSSQCWKRAIREEFKRIAPERRGTRTKRLRETLLDALVDAGAGGRESLAVPVTRFIELYYAGMDRKRKEETNVLVFYSPAEFATMVSLLTDPDMLKELRKETVGRRPEIERRLKASALSLDVALFARMLADSPGLNVDAACQVAHAISTHGVNLELDFFTAVDDLKDPRSGDAGAAMIGALGFDSACYYRYALVDCAQLAQNLSGSVTDSEAALDAFLTAFCNAVPGGKRNSFAHGAAPFLALFVVRSAGTASSLVNAFARPVNYRQGDLLETSAQALARMAGRMESCYNLYGDSATVRPFLAHVLEAPDLTGLPTTTNLSMREARQGVIEAVAALAGAGR
jgi:CRISPR system Cascade subunit CasC